jgi:enoyl-CoA hydratase
MSFVNILYEVKEGIARLTVNRPDKLNALNRRTVTEIGEALDAFEKDAEARALLLTGAGEKAFVAGADIAELAEQTPQGGKEYSLFGQDVLGRLESSGKPTIAAINGFALGGGLELALACQLRIAAETASLGLPEVTLAIIPGFGGTQRLPRLVGRGKALEMILTGERIDAKEAHRVGLVNRVVPLADLVAEADKLARTILSRGPVAVRYAIEAVTRGLEMPLEEGLFLEATLFGLLTTTDDMKEGTRAFLEKRKPAFRGR